VGILDLRKGIRKFFLYFILIKHAISIKNKGMLMLSTTIIGNMVSPSSEEEGEGKVTHEDGDRLSDTTVPCTDVPRKWVDGEGTTLGI
jgi:hypothetical protein